MPNNKVSLPAPIVTSTLLPRRRLVSLMCCIIVVGQSHAMTTWTVTSNATGYGICNIRAKTCTTLKGAIAAASNGKDADQKIVFGSSFSNGEVIEDEFLINSKNNLTIDGASKGVVLVGDASSGGRSVIENYSTAAVSLNYLTLQNSECGIYNEGTGAVTVNYSTISDNQCGIASHHGIMTINNSIISRNSYGGISIGYGALIINNSTISDNSSNITGGGISNEGGELTINNSTIVRNTGYRGGGIYTTSSITINHSTITDNTATYDAHGGGIFVNGYGSTGMTANIRSTIIAANKVNGEADGSPDIYCYCNYGGAIVSLGHNLIGDGSATGLVSNSNGDQVGGAGVDAIDPEFILDETLQPLLADNGGSTPTIALQSSSPAIGGGDCTSSPAVATDQRGYQRATPCTIGAFEYGAVSNRQF